MGRWEPAAGMPYWTCQTNPLRPCFLSWLFTLYTNTHTNSSTSLFVPKGSPALSSRGQLAFWKSTFFHLLLSSQSQETNPPAAVKAWRHNMPTTTLSSLRVPSRGEHLRSARLSSTFLFQKPNKQNNKQHKVRFKSIPDRGDSWRKRKLGKRSLWTLESPLNTDSWWRRLKAIHCSPPYAACQDKLIPRQLGSILFTLPCALNISHACEGFHLNWARWVVATNSTC